MTSRGGPRVRVGAGPLGKSRTAVLTLVDLCCVGIVSGEIARPRVEQESQGPGARRAGPRLPT
eukprot:1412540-Pyramimonas_sp.AAC.1